MQYLYFISFKRIFSTMFLVLLALGCSNVIATSGAMPHATSRLNLELIYGFEVTKDKVLFVVNSNGCSKPEDFELNWDAHPNNTYSLTLMRTKTDRCRAMPRAFPIEFPLEHGIDKHTKLIVSNPFGVKTDSNSRL